MRGKKDDDELYECEISTQGAENVTRNQLDPNLEVDVYLNVPLLFGATVPIALM